MTHVGRISINMWTFADPVRIVVSVHFNPFAFFYVCMQEVLQYKLDNSVVLFLVAVIEYIAADILNLAGKYVLNIPHERITQEDIRIALIADQVRNFTDVELLMSILCHTMKQIKI